MEIMALPGNFEIAPGFRVDDWRSLTLNVDEYESPDWQRAFAILNARIRKRFIEPAQLLIDSENPEGRGTNGFAVLAIDFLLIETLQGFRSGQLNHFRKSKALFEVFLSEWPPFAACVPLHQDRTKLAGRVYEQGRCALHHTGATDQLIVKRSGSLFVFHDDGRIEINRSRLHTDLTASFDFYLHELSAAPNAELRKNFKDKMDHICS